MTYSVFRLNHVHPDPHDGHEQSDRYRAALDMVEFLDKRGLNAVQFDEHHVSSVAWSPTPMLNAGMVLARTENVLCMIGALLLPLHDPIRVAEDLAVLDLVSRGRIVVTMGLGYRPLEYTAMDKEWSRRGRIMDESLDVLMKAWSGEPFEHHGETVQVLPKPFTSPHPQIMIGGSAKASAQRAARLGLPLYMNGNPPGIKELYEELCAENGSVPFCIAPEEAPQVHVVEDPDRAWAELGEHFLLEARTYADWQPEGQNSPVHSHAATVEDLRAEGIYRFLTPDQAREFATQKGSVTIHPLVGGMPVDEAWRSVELFADAVLTA
jgi:alkanesulfonate monooxygenase SsuD/methylene tetrahydromethanopterin reductase-like flavin-dependent oxidoreductase (luciferase family)